MMIIAIDGTLASGKGTLAKRLAAHFGVPHMDTGALYRATGVAATIAGVDLTDEEACAEIAAKLDLTLYPDADLRTAEAGQSASKVAALSKVRQALFELQRSFAGQKGGAVLDGRDIGTVVCPEADVKFWVDASVEERARRRCMELEKAGKPISLEQMIAELRERDIRDKTREVAPMKPAEDALQLDTTQMGPDDVFETALNFALKKGFVA
ncbi:cytidylate kinase [Hirschia baltica ATCC 49814]|uniref:Cytidylate kinase n=2 Tax=Hirschia TaxID=2723 RepID=C6XN87_HIRBI|nr:(d)CMP kinase [Hirschia baltica]ACT60031.1 cytidylate kinase [Hirschia baltica ATCC 49814]